MAGLAAFGGGTLRDVLLDRRPIFWVEHANGLWGLMALCVMAMFFMRARHFAPTERAMQWPYAVCSFFGGWVLVAAQALQAPAWLGLTAAVAVAAGLRALALGSGYTLPRWSAADPAED